MIEVGEAGPPHRATAVAEFHVLHDNILEIPAEIFRESGRLMIAIFSREGSISWEFPIADFLEAVQSGIEILGG
jgi:hypothetical protein